MANKKNTATEDALGALHAVVAHELMGRIQSGEATSADINAAIKFLKDNGITCAVDDSADLAVLAKEVPVFIGCGEDEEG